MKNEEYNFVIRIRFHET